MAGIYIHIPFCRQACHYCNFHFSTVLTYKEKLVGAIAKELFLRKDELSNEKIETVYFGGGTPSLLNKKEWDILFTALHTHYDLSGVKEFTVEANPDDLNKGYLQFLRDISVNRLSIGIQSFEDEHLQLMNRAHNAIEAINCVKDAQDLGITNISVDLIYGIPGMSKASWLANLEKVSALQVPHLSSYCLTVEPKTVFGNWQQKSMLNLPSDEESEWQFFALQNFAETHGFEQYEISNFSKPNSYALHNTNYWRGIPYAGFGPGAHSYLPGIRKWNKGNNPQYIKALEDNEFPSEFEVLSLNDQYNEFIMTGLRTQWGVQQKDILSKFGPAYLEAFEKQMAKHLLARKILRQNGTFVLSKSARFLADGISADGFIL